MGVEIGLRNDTVVVVMWGLIEWKILRVVLVAITHVISNEVNHNPNTLLMSSVHQGF